MVADTWSPTASMRTLKHFLVDAEKHKARVHQIDFIVAFFLAKANNRVFVKLDIRYAYFSRICTILWKSLKIVEVHVWDDQLW